LNVSFVVFASIGRHYNLLFGKKLVGYKTFSSSQNSYASIIFFSLCINNLLPGALYEATQEFQEQMELLYR